ncbi:two-component response regulator-like APRR5 isoform X2 [Arachis ipaensis]|uniref:two-component response regulator-like APRR5 isoform X2 n=1 Tax=Arachis ipaensis TaxID=130454 RepID=UPI0007AF20F7|nr:two-component response regulator-like APRR5 isoform X2 [Arachis ipaensis]
MDDEVQAFTIAAAQNDDGASTSRMKGEQIAKNEDCNGNGGGEEVIRWEKILARRVVRVLVVEADNSTRHIITAILRKCSYSVIAVSDGLKAWEVLKKKATDLDLILTEVDLPAISGFALITLIMEHDFCKNIPVIMMSSQDSVNMVLKCMLKGAVDFLIKPVRRNELKNLWRHVWRRHAIDKPPQNTTFPMEKLKTVSQDNSTSNQSSAFVASLQENNGCGENLSEAHSTCTSSFLEAENACMEKRQDASELKLNNVDVVHHEVSINHESKSSKHNDEIVGLVSESAICNKSLKSTDLMIERDHCFAEIKSQDEVLRAESSRANPNINVGIHGCTGSVVEPSRGATDWMIDTFENIEKPINENCSYSGDNTTKSVSDTKMELLLRSDLSDGSCKQASEITEERQRLKHSDTSAFSRYSGHKLLQPSFPLPLITSSKVTNNDQNSQESHKSSGNTLDTCQYGSTGKNEENRSTLVIGQYGQFEPKSSSNECGLFPFSKATSDIKSKEHCNILSSTGQSSGNSLSSDAAKHKSSIAYESVGSGSDGNDTSNVVPKNNPETFSECVRQNYDGFGGTNFHHFSQRQAALTKFRLKRKQRSYGKKVRYETRQRLAEQRPRVKGQFVRKVLDGDLVPDSGGNS